MGIEKAAFTARYEAANLQLLADLRETCFPLASLSAVANHVLTLARKAIEEGCIHPDEDTTQAIRCGNRPQSVHSEQGELIRAWLIQIAMDFMPEQPMKRKGVA